MGGAGHITIAANKGIKMDIARKVEAADAYIDLDRANADEQWAQIKKDNPCKFEANHISRLSSNVQTASMLLSSAPVLRRSPTTLSTTSPEAVRSLSTVSTPTTRESLGRPPRSSSMRSSEHFRQLFTGRADSLASSDHSLRLTVSPVLSTSLTAARSGRPAWCKSTPPR